MAPKGAYRRPLAGIYLIQHKIKRSTFASERSNPAATPKARTFIRPLAGFLYAPAYSKGYFQPLGIFRAAESAAATFGDKKALAYLYRLTLETQRLEQLVKTVVELTKELLQWCRK